MYDVLLLASTCLLDSLQTDVFFLTSPNVGKMQKIKVKSSGSGLGAAWHLARVVITSSATGEILTFPFNNWIDKEHGLEQVWEFLCGKW
jgi:hypothetical protein